MTYLNNYKISPITNYLDDGEQILEPSKYYDIENISNLICPCNSPFTVLSLNAQCLQSKLDSLKIYINNLIDSSVTFDAICVQETWINNDADCSLFKLDGYQLITKSKTCGKHGGLAIYLKDEISYRTLEVPFKHANLWECQILEIKLNRQNKKILLGNIYRPPRNLKENQEKFLEDLEVLLEILDNISGTFILAGDFNINLIKIEEILL